MENRNLVTIGRIIGVHGIRGSIKIMPLTDFPRRFLMMESLAVYGEDDSLMTVLSIEKIRIAENKGVLIADTIELQTVEEAECLRGGLIKIPEEERYALEEGEYWVDDLIGVDVYEKTTNCYLGKIKDVFSAGEMDIYAVISEDGKEHFIPAVSEFIKEVDIENQNMKIELIEGLWE